MQMDSKHKQTHSKLSLNQSKYKRPEIFPIKPPLITKDKDSFAKDKDNQTMLFKDSNIERAMQSTDLNAKINSLSNELSVLKEKLTDINHSNTYLKNKLKEKTPNSQRPLSTSNANALLPQQSHMQFKSQFNIDKSLREAYIKSSRMLNHNSNNNNNNTNLNVTNDKSSFNTTLQLRKENNSNSNGNAASKEEVKEKEKQIELLKEKSKKLESLVITLESKLDKSNTLLPNILSKAKEYHRLYDETKKENEKIRHQSKYSKDSQVMQYDLISIDPNDNNDREKDKEVIASLSNANKALKEDKDHLHKTIEEMKTSINHLVPFKTENDKLINDLLKIRAENTSLRSELTNKTDTLRSITNENHSLRSNIKQIEVGYNNQVIALNKEKDLLIKENKRLINDNANYDRKALDDTKTIDKFKELNGDLQGQLDSLRKETIEEKEALHIENKRYLLRLEDIISLYNELNNEAKGYKSQIELLNQCILEHKNDMSQLKSTYDNKESIEVSKYKDLLKDKEIQVKQLESTIGEKDNDITELKLKIKTIEESNGEGISSLIIINQTLQGENTKLTNDNEAKDKEVNQLEKAVKQLKDEIRNKDDDINQCIKAKEELVLKFNTTIQCRDKEIEANEGSINEKDSLIQSLKKEIEETIKNKDNEVLKLSNDNKELIDKLNIVVKDKDKDIQAKTDEFKNITLILNENKKMSNDIIEEQKSTVAQLTSSNTALQTELSEIKLQCNKQSNTNANLLNELNQLKESYTQLEKSSNEKIIKEKSDLESKLNTLTVSIEEDKEKSNKQLDDLNKKIKSLMTDNDTKAKEINDHMKIIEKKDLDYNRLQKENLDLTNDILTVQSKLTEAENKVKRGLKDNEESESKINQLTTTLNDRDVQIAALVEVNIKLEEYEGLIKTNAELNERIKEINKRHNEDVKSNDTNSKDQLAIKDNIINQLTAECDNKNNAIEQIKTSLNKINDDYNTLKELNANTELELNITLIEKDNTIALLGKDIEALTKKVNEYKEIIIEKDKAISDYKECIEVNQRNYKESKDKETVSMNALQASSEDKLNEATKQIDHLNLILNAKNSDIGDLNHQIESKDNTIKTLQCKLTESSNTIAQLEQDINQKHIELTQLATIKEDNATLKESNEQLSHSIKEYEHKSIDRDNLIKEQQDKITQLNQSNNDYTTQYTLQQSKHSEDLNALINSNNELKSQSLQQSKDLIQLETELKEKNTQYNKNLLFINILKGDMAQMQTELTNSKSLNEKLQLELKKLKDKHTIELNQLKSQDASQKEENDRLTAQLLILTTNSMRNNNKIEQMDNQHQHQHQHQQEHELNEASIELLNKKEEEYNHLKAELTNTQIELNTLKEEYTALSSQIVTLKETIIQKDIAIQDNEESYKSNLNIETSKLKEEVEALSTKVTQLSSLPIEIDRLTNLLSERDLELLNYQKINDKLIQVNQELSEKVNLESIESPPIKTKEGKMSEEEDKGSLEMPLDKDEYMSLLMKNDTLNELIRNKEDEIKALRKELDNYRTEVNNALAYDNESNTDKPKDKGKESSSLVSSFNQNDDGTVSKLEDYVVKIKKAYKDKSTEVKVYQQQLSLLKGDIRNYQSKMEKIKQDYPIIEDYDSFKTKLITVLNDYKPKKKEQIEIVKEIRKDIGHEEGTVKDKDTEKKKGLFDFFKN